MHEDRDAPAGHHQIGPTRQAAAAQPIADARRTQNAAHGELRRGVASLHSAHHRTALFRSEGIGSFYHPLIPAKAGTQFCPA